MRVVILMSTYNGERFVEEQLRSILEQLPAEGRVIIRDDGSTDATVERVREIDDPRITLTRGENVGFARSFLTLMAHAPTDADMYMLSDQDDVWLQTKIDRAWMHLKDRLDEPVLYCSRMQLVDVNLNPIELSVLWPRAPSFENALTENIVTGCTAAFSLPALNLVKKAGVTGQIYFHDWWLYLVVSSLGEVIVDPTPTILYRQHGQNVIGMAAGFRRYLAILRFLRKVNWIHIMFNQIDNFRLTHGSSLNDVQLRFITRFFDHRRPTSMVRLFLVPQRLRQSLIGDLLFRGLLLATAISSGLSPKRLPSEV